MKNILYSFFLGGIIGAGASYLFLSKSTPVRAIMTVTSSNPLAKISNQSLVVKSKRQIIEATASFETDKKGTFTNLITINKRDVQFHHSIYGDTSYLFTSQTLLFSAGYSYKYFLIKGLVGYSFRLQEMEYGFGIGGKYSF